MIDECEFNDLMYDIENDLQMAKWAYQNNHKTPPTDHLSYAITSINTLIGRMNDVKANG